jgi:hypothetical protein
VLGAVGAYLLLRERPEVARARADSVDRLASARTAKELEATVGDLGILILLRDGSWIAVRYRDSHALPIWSSAVALDSSGRWYASENHYCGTFKIYRARWDRILEVLSHPDATREEKRDILKSFWDESTELTRIERASSLEAARAALQAIGFRELDCEVKPRLRGPLPGRPEDKETVARRLIGE